MKRFLKRQWPLIGLGVIVAVVAFHLLRSGEKIVQQPLFEEIMAGDGLKLKDIHYIQDDRGEALKWVLDAREVRFSGDKRAIFFHDFSLRVEPENRPFFKLKGETGNYSRDSGEINLLGNLEGFFGERYRILTDHMLINEKSKCLSTNSRVKIYGPFFSVEGQGLFADLEKESLKIPSDVTAIIAEESLL